MIVCQKLVEKMSMGGEDMISWPGIGAEQSGAPIELQGHVDMHIQVQGELGGGRLVMQGSNVTAPTDDDWAYLADKQGLAIQFLAIDLIKRADTVPRWVRPKAEGGGTDTNVRVLIAMRKG